MYDFLLNKVTTRKTTMKKSKNSLGPSETTKTANAECSEREVSDLPRTCNNNSDMVTSFHIENGNQQTTSNPFNYRKEERESNRLNMPQSSLVGKGGLRRSRMYKSRQQPSDERESQISIVADSMVYEVAIVKFYGLLKDELRRPDVIRISKKLFPGDTELLLEIDSANKRRRVADILLKRILECSQEKQSQFIWELRTDQCSKLLVDSVDIKEVSKKDLTKYRMVHNLHYETKLLPFPSRKLMFSIHDNKTLKDLLNNEDYIDRINDLFLSKFLFTVGQHSCITNEEIQSRKKVTRLLDEKQKCDEKVYKSFKKFLKSLDMEGILQNLEYEKENSRTRKKREHMSENESDIECRHIRKKKKLDRNIEYAVVSYNRKDEKVKTEFEQIGLSIENFENGSIIVTFSAKDASAWEKLKQYCQRGSIDRLVKDIFNHESIPEELKDGTFKMKLTIYESKESTSDLKKGILVLENNDETSETSIIDTPNDPVTEVLLEELDITNDLLKFLKKECLVDINIENEIAKEQGRKQKVHCLLQNILKHAKDGYTILTESYIKSNNDYLHKVLMEKNNLKQVHSELEKSRVKANDPRKDLKMLLYRCTATFGIETEDSARNIDSGNRSITCLGITDSQCFFDDRRSDIDSGHDKRKEKSINLGSPIMPKKMKQDEDEEEKERRKGESKERKLSIRGRKKESKS